MYAILWTTPEETKIYGPFDTAQKAAVWAVSEMPRPLGSTAVIMKMESPKT